jgi:tRNA nucleotidyltransferase (CCA-adding enzyme)
MPVGHRVALTTTEKLNFRGIPARIQSIVRQLRDNNFQVYLVGGAVRDLLRGQTPGDWDLATSALPDQVELVFPQSVPTGKPFGTITVIEDEQAFEITTFREDLGYSDGRHPDALRFGTDILPDLARRDFTINAMAYDFATMELVDPFQGRRDCYHRILRTVGEPGVRFAEDGLRMFRFFRFIATQDLKPHRDTERAINPTWAKPVSIERIRAEFDKLLLGKWVRKGLTGLKQSGLLDVFLPELNAEYQVYRGHFNRFDLLEHLFTATETIEPRLHLRLAALFHDIAKPETGFQDRTGHHFYGHDQRGTEISCSILERMRYPRKLIESVSTLIRWHMFSMPSQAGDGAIRRLILKVGPENIPDLLELRRADIVATGRIDAQTWENWQYQSTRILEILKGQPAINPKSLDINGHDLVTILKLEPGPLIGEILGYLVELTLDQPGLNQKSQLLDLAKEYLAARRL